MNSKTIDLMTILTLRIPGLRIRNKSDSWIWRNLIPRKLRDMGQCLPTIRRVNGRPRIVPVIWLPDHLDKDLFGLLAHEGQHALDIAAGPWRFIWRYLTRRGRADLELRGYMVSIHARFSRKMGIKCDGRIGYADRFARLLSSRVYLWPCSYDYALERLLEYCAHVHRGTPVDGLPVEMMEILDGLEGSDE